MNFFIGVLIFTLSVLFKPAHAVDANDGEKLFALKIMPLFSQKCLPCHGGKPNKIKSKFDMRSRKSILLGGEIFGAEVLKPGRGEKSYLYLLSNRVVEDLEMPPKEADKLTKQESAWIREWINLGAPWPSEERSEWIQEDYAKGERVLTSRALSEDWQKRRYEKEKLWAYRPLKIKKVPRGKNPIDWFVDRKLDELGLEPAPLASPEDLFRRLSFGLTGLPPEFEEIMNFRKEFKKSRNAVTKHGSKMMSSPHYGEHFAKHWLDVARYADSGGFANDYSRANAWRYRDYVVRAFNEDKPYDRFVLEQVAGDEMDPTQSENLIATGFLRMGPWEQTGMSVFKETRQLWLDDVTDSVGQTFLAHAMQCAKCHDHKFDPVPTRDYYRMMAVFSTTQLAERHASFHARERTFGFSRFNNLTNAKIAYYEEDEASLQDKINRLKKKEKALAKEGNNGLGPGDEASQSRLFKNLIRHRLELDRTKPLVHAVFTGKTISRQKVMGKLTMPKEPWKHGYFDPDVIYNGGNVYSLGESVEPGALSAAESLGGMMSEAFPKRMGKRRLALAKWIVHPSNPLTARVMVNRIWSWHFGRGIAGNPNNFGGTGHLPTHPELLDFLAHWFVKSGWSVKKLNHLILSSETYRRSSLHPKPRVLEKIDPNRESYAVFSPRRLTAEEIRDAMLTISGELNPAVGGIPARPDLNSEVAFQPRQIMGGVASVYEPDPSPEQRNRRTLYVEKIRGLRDPFLETFNQPGPDNSCELRETSLVAPQALTLMNSEEVQDRALALANRLLKTKEKRFENQVIERAFRLVLGRVPSEQEAEACLRRWQEATTVEEDKIPQIPQISIVVSRTVMAEKTGEPYTFKERLPAYEIYKADLQRHQVDAQTRALAQVCLVLFNLNEFSYVY